MTPTQDKHSLLRLKASDLKKITNEHMLKAIADLDQGVEHSFADSTGFDLVHEGKRYPPKAVFGVAGRYALGRELLPEHFSGGVDSFCFRVLKEAGFEVISKRRAFLLIWNPSHFTFDQFRELLDQVERGEPETKWGSGSRRDVPVSSRVYLMRLGVEPKGIVGIGISTRAVHQEPHWVPERAERGDMANYVPFRVLRLQEEPFIPLEVLNGKWPAMGWTPQTSGVEIHDAEVIAFLDAALGNQEPRIPEEVSEDEVHTEGAVTRITVNAYERDPKARKKCLAHHGFNCACCRKAMKDIYGPIAKDIIHVHHRTPLHAVGKEYQVVPIKDLVPVCPNCHAVLHRQAPTMAVEDLMRMLGNL